MPPAFLVDFFKGRSEIVEGEIFVLAQHLDDGFVMRTSSFHLLPLLGQRRKRKRALEIPDVRQ
ncbi:hypothetical protein FQZ97_1125710 [compost metagenome]